MLTDDDLDLLFRKARSHNGWLRRPVSDDVLRQLYELMKWGATSANSSPARIVFIRTREGKERLRPALAPGNVDKVMTAPVTAIVAYDLQFYRNFPKLFPRLAPSGSTADHCRDSTTPRSTRSSLAPAHRVTDASRSSSRRDM